MHIGVKYSFVVINVEVYSLAVDNLIKMLKTVEHPCHKEGLLGHFKIFTNCVKSCCHLEEGNNGKIGISDSLVGLITGELDGRNAVHHGANGCIKHTSV